MKVDNKPSVRARDYATTATLCTCIWCKAVNVIKLRRMAWLGWRLK